MEAKELIIGDWVYGLSNSPRKVQGLRDYNEENVVVADHWVNCKQLTPILLTEAILTKNGFAKRIDDMGDKYCEIKDYGYTIYYFFDYNVINITIGRNHIFVEDKKFVHELQHVLRLCGLTDLADNFEV